MSHILNKKAKNIDTNKKIVYLLDKSEKKNHIVHYTPSIHEWHNSIYNFNKNRVIYTLIKDKLTNILLNSYFNSKPTNIRKIFNRSLFSLNKIFVGKSEIRHYTNKVSITVYTLNKTNQYLLKELLPINNIFYNKWVFKNLRFNLKSKIKNLNFTNLFSNYNVNNSIINSKKFKIFNFVHLMIKNIKLFNHENKHLNINKNLFIIYLINKVLNHNIHKIYKYKLYTALLFFNNLKFNNNTLLGLKTILSNIYNKKVELNIIKLKYFYLENTILSSIVVKKLNDRKNNILKVIRKAIKIVKTPRLDPFILIPNKNSLMKNIDSITNFYKDFFIIGKYNKQKSVFKDLKNKHVIGVRLEGKGRLTKRLTASRSIIKYNYKGSLRNIYSSFQKLSVIMLKGFEKSNLQYTNINSKNRNGSFGLKSWINSF